MTKTLIAILLIALSPAPARAGRADAPPAAAVVIMSVENMHSRPTDVSDVVSQAKLGENVKILKSERNADGQDWSRIETPDSYPGWIISSALRFLKPGDKPYASSGKVLVVSSLLANTYREPSVTAHKPVNVAPIGTVLEVVGEKGERWLEVNLPSNAKAWIQKGDGALRDATWTWPRLPIADMVALAKRFIGLPYTWGGTSPLGLDCSGFVQLVYKLGGIPILRDAGIQMTQSGLVEVPKGQEQAGDLIFFGRAPDRISHVGMMIDGEYFINATTSDAPIVQIDRLADENWTRIYQAARRPSDRSER
jgi:gamma-D-glutamyl-L-lysine dipeptidyl-peptidase